MEAILPLTLPSTVGTERFVNFLMKKHLLFILACALFVGCAGRSHQTLEPAIPEKQAPLSPFVHSYGDGKTPWTDKPFQNDPQMFQFAIVSDRTGGPRAGVFPKAMEKVNLLHPEFVMSVGDLINGYVEDKKEIESEWREFNAFLKPLEMPFFYVAGNHDVFDQQSATIWEQQFGRRYYAFVYKDVLFLCLNSQESETHYLRAGLGAEQTAWAKEVLKEHPQVRWTMVFVHQPLWLYQEKGNRYEGPYQTGFGEIEDALADRRYTVFAGHYHRYTKFQRRKRDYYILGTTGGHSPLRGAEYGEFDHGMWITMTEHGPKIANLTLDGILTDGVYTEVMNQFEEGLKFTKKSDSGSVELDLEIKNPFSHPLAFNLQWHAPSTSTWTITPRVSEGAINAGSSKTVRVVFHPGKEQFPLPQAKLQLQAGDDYGKELSLSSSHLLFNYEQSHLEAPRAQRSPKIDGKLEEKIWQQAPWNTPFRHYQSFQLESAKTKVWAYYDSTHLYLAFDCPEERMGDLQLTSERRDHLQWQDNGVEIFIRPDLQTNDYYQMIVNADGLIFDGKGQDSKHNLKFDAKTLHRRDGYSVEIAIPWLELGNPTIRSGKEIGLLLVRNRPSTDGILQFPPMNSPNHTPERFGILQLGK